jgi:2-methylcitrate dehydratase PrpD
MEVTKTLAQFVVDSRYDAIPEKVRHEAKRSVLNWLGCAIGASRHEGIDIALSGIARLFRRCAGEPAWPRRASGHHACGALERHQLAYV